MILESILASILVASVSLIGVLFVGNNKFISSIQKHIAPIAVGMFLSLVLFELIPETLELSPEYGGIAVAVGFIAFYILSAFLHKRYHDFGEENCDRRGAAMLLLIGDAVHNVADGVIIGGAFLISPTIGFATAVGLALHEIPQEIIEFGVLIRAGYTKTQALWRNFISASSIVLGTLLIILVAQHAEEYIWLLTGVAAGNLLFLAASDLLPRIHGDLKYHGSIWKSATAIFVGFTIMTVILAWTHEYIEHGHTHEDDEQHSELHKNEEHDHDEEHDVINS